MNLNTTTDPITSKQSYYINNEEQLALFKNEINPQKTFIGLYHNEVRFLTKDNILVKFNNSDVLKTYTKLGIENNVNQDNYIAFNLEIGHAAIDFLYYKNLTLTYDYYNQVVGGIAEIKLSNESLIFYLSNEQADYTYNVLEHFKDELKNYSYVPLARDCVGFLRDISKSIKIGNFAKYFTDYELLNELVYDTTYPSYRVSTKFISFISNYYHLAICEDPDRNKVSHYFESNYGADFRLDWSYIKKLPINQTYIAKNSYIKLRYNEIQSSYIRFAETILDAFNLSNETKEKYFKHINDSLSNNYLYDYQTLNYRLDIYNLLKEYEFIDNIKSQIFDTAQIAEQICGLDYQCYNELKQTGILTLIQYNEQ